MLTDTLPITITQKAIEEVKQILTKKNIPLDYGLRVGIRGGGCGAAFFIGFDTQKEKDDAYEVDGVPVFIDRRHLMYLMGVMLTFEERREERGFVFAKEQQ